MPVTVVSQLTNEVPKRIYRRNSMTSSDNKKGFKVEHRILLVQANSELEMHCVGLVLTWLSVLYSLYWYICLKYLLFFINQYCVSSIGNILVANFSLSEIVWHLYHLLLSKKLKTSVWSLSFYCTSKIFSRQTQYDSYQSFVYIIFILIILKVCVNITTNTYKSILIMNWKLFLFVRLLLKSLNRLKKNISILR